MIVYSNSCSFGKPYQGHMIYPEVVAKHHSAQRLINAGKDGSCNRRIIRTTLRDLVELDRSDVTALVGLSFLHRTETWNPSLGAIDNDGDFNPIPVNWEKHDWSKGFFKTSVPDIYKDVEGDLKLYYREWLLNVFNPEGAVTDLLADIIMLRAFAVQRGIDLWVFNNTQTLPGPPDVDYDAPFLASLNSTITKDKHVLDLRNFSFADYAQQLGHRPKDEHKFGPNGHPNAQAHEDFGRYLIDYMESNR